MFDDPDDKCRVRTIEEFYRIKEAYLLRKVAEYDRQLSAGGSNDGQEKAQAIQSPSNVIAYRRRGSVSAHKA